MLLCGMLAGLAGAKVFYSTPFADHKLYLHRGKPIMTTLRALHLSSQRFAGVNIRTVTICVRINYAIFVLFWGLCERVVCLIVTFTLISRGEWFDEKIQFK